jgi:hypothetical protein
VNNVEETWKDIENYVGYYQISNIGRVKSLARVIKRNDNIIKTVRKRILRVGKNPNGYYLVVLSKKNKHKPILVARLVAKTFIPNLLNKPCVNHINGIKTDNRLENLEWVTYSENNQHAFDTGLKNSKTIEKKVLMLSLDNEPLLWFDSMTEASKMCEINLGNIVQCCKGKRKTAGKYKWKYYKEATKC